MRSGTATRKPRRSTSCCRGPGRSISDDDEVDVARLDAIRVAPNVIRGFEAGDDGLELLVFSQSTPGDAEIVADFFDE